MTKGNKIAIGCLGSLLLAALIVFLSLQWAKQKIIAVVADNAQEAIVTEIENSPLPDDQKKAFIVAVDEILQNISNGEIDFTLGGKFSDRPKAVGIITSAVKNAVNKLEIDEGQKAEIAVQVDRLGNAYSSDLINEKQISSIADKLFNGQFGSMLAIWAAEANYIHGSGLSEEEKQAAHVTLGRLCRGLKSDKISRKELESLTDPYTAVDAEGNKQFKGNLTDSEIREILKKSNELLSENGTSEEPLKLDIGQELKDALDASGVPE